MVYPDAADVNWAEGNGGRADRLGIDDVGFVEDLVAMLNESYTIDLKRIYAIGFSQGGFFTHRLGIDLHGIIAACATVASSMSLMISQRYYTPSEIPVLMIQGMHDSVFLWNGENDGIFSYLSQSDIVKRILENNHCEDNPVVTELPDLVNDNKRVIKISYLNQDNINIVEYYKIENGGHEWPAGDLNTAEVILKFFFKFSKQ